jgi:hypothetical protein
MIAEVAGDGELPAVQSGVAESGDAVFGGEFEVTKLRPGEQTITLASTIFI